ncbi:MAG TPA: family 16 glycoside hydrolase, partial [Isosphaeraceae bacterium]|nr:family 16 glycoside hydrolase [Isosphaeraceae bacterium]
MSRYLAPIAAFLLVTSFSLADEPQSLPDFARQTPDVKSGDPVFAFNGKDLSGFSTYLKEHKTEDPLGVFTVVDGVIRVSGEEYGGFATKEEYGNYHLIA